MIEVYFSQKEVVEGTRFSLRAEGHADYAENGKDIVCSGVTALFMGLTNKLEELAKNNKAVNDITASEGMYDCKTLSQLFVDTREVESAYTTVLYGLKGIEAQYPKNLIIH